jgi:hypothetical protein
MQIFIDMKKGRKKEENVKRKKGQKITNLTLKG